MGVVMKYSSGQKDVKKVAKRQINISTGNVTSYSYLMNVPLQFVQFQKENDLDATLGDMHSEKFIEKEATA